MCLGCSGVVCGVLGVGSARNLFSHLNTHSSTLATESLPCTSSLVLDNHVGTAFATACWLPLGANR